MSDQIRARQEVVRDKKQQDHWLVLLCAVMHACMHECVCCGWQQLWLAMRIAGQLSKQLAAVMQLPKLQPFVVEATFRPFLLPVLSETQHAWRQGRGSSTQELTCRDAALGTAGAAAAPFIVVDESPDSSDRAGRGWEGLKGENAAAELEVI
jgi:hypothetical protein